MNRKHKAGRSIAYYTGSQGACCLSSRGVQRANRRGPCGTHAGFPNAMMKHSQDIDIARRTTRFHDTTSPKPKRLSLSFSIGRRTEDCVEGRKEERRRKGGGSRGLNRKLWGSIIGEPRSSTVNQGLLLSSRKFRGEGRRERGDKRRRLIPREHFVRSENW